MGHKKKGDPIKLVKPPLPVIDPPKKQTRTDIGADTSFLDESILKQQAEDRANAGFPQIQQDHTKGTAEEIAKGQQAALEREETLRNDPGLLSRTGEKSKRLVTDESGRTLIGLNRSDVQDFAGLEARRAGNLGLAGLQNRQAGTLQSERDAEINARLIAQAGQIGPSTGITPTGLDVGEAFTQGLVGSIPGAIRQAGQFAAAAAVIGGTAGSVVPGIGTAIGVGGGCINRGNYRFPRRYNPRDDLKYEGTKNR